MSGSTFTPEMLSALPLFAPDAPLTEIFKLCPELETTVEFTDPFGQSASPAISDSPSASTTEGIPDLSWSPFSETFLLESNPVSPGLFSAMPPAVFPTSIPPTDQKSLLSFDISPFYEDLGSLVPTEMQPPAPSSQPLLNIPTSHPKQPESSSPVPLHELSMAPSTSQEALFSMAPHLIEESVPHPMQRMRHSVDLSADMSANLPSNLSPDYNSRRSRAASTSGVRCPMPNCGKTFTRFHNLRAHMRTHEATRPFSCPMCPRAFTRKHDLQRHVRVHTGDKPYTCPSCKKSFSRTDAMKRHFKVEETCRNSPEVQTMRGRRYRRYSSAL
ncbi:uncharacterized protein VTP21DRAFT_2365 [Calcarisporiella thermophila]|uniref:uncharacterized protein n=1 Tax=Calcarisporiella thermophila TaxID=911321 RepID=UPI0037422B13